MSLDITIFGVGLATLLYGLNLLNLEVFSFNMLLVNLYFL